MTQEELLKSLKDWVNRVESDVINNTHHIEHIEYSSPTQESFENDGSVSFTQPVYNIHITVVKYDTI